MWINRSKETRGKKHRKGENNTKEKGTSVKRETRKKKGHKSGAKRRKGKGESKLLGGKSETRAKEKEKPRHETGDERPGLLVPVTHQVVVGGGVCDVHERARHHRALRGSHHQQQQRRNPSAPCCHCRGGGCPQRQRAAAAGPARVRK